MSRQVRVFRGEDELAAVPADDRGLAYGDGLFETLRVHGGDAPWWSRHWARLATDAARLGIAVPDEARVRAVLTALFDDAGDGVCKLLLTRGGGGRGYAPPLMDTGARPAPTWIVSRHALPAAWPADGIVVDWCATTLGASPRLAGIKHCNRLEQVLARAEWHDSARHEGLLCDASGRVVTAIAANLAWCEDGQWLTPTVTAGAIAGICRGWLITHGVREVEPPSPARLLAAEALLLCNAVRGILPVQRLGERVWPATGAAHAWRQRLIADAPMFAVAGEAIEARG